MIAIAAMTKDRVIGIKNQIPWKLSEDLRWFKKMTMGHPVLMGRRTFESLGKPLSGRMNLVVSGSASFEGVEMIRNLDLFDPSRYESEVMVIGGAQIYAALLPRCETLLITRIKAPYAGDTFFPEFEASYILVEKIRETPDFEILRYSRRSRVPC